MTANQNTKNHITRQQNLMTNWKGGNQMNRIKEIRKENNITQTRLAKYFHVTPDLISKWERGYSNPSISDLHTLAQIFKVSMEYLGGYSNERNGHGN